MPLYIARLLGPVSWRLDWAQPQLSYLPSGLYRSVIRIDHFLRRR